MPTTLQPPPTPRVKVIPPARRPRRPRPRPERRAERIGLFVSLLLHLIALLVAASIVVEVDFSFTPTPSPSPPPAPEGMKAYQLRIGSDAAPPIEEQLAQTEPEARRTTAPTGRTAGPVPEAPVSSPDAAPNAADRLRPRALDPRLQIRPEDVAPPPPSDIDRVRSRVARRLREWNDSVGVAADDPNLDWTLKGKNGEKWGVSPGKIHLGTITLPLPVGVGPPAGRRDDIRERTREWEETQVQAGREGAREGIDERARAIRERRDRERSEGADSTRT